MCVCVTRCERGSVLWTIRAGHSGGDLHKAERSLRLVQLLFLYGPARPASRFQPSETPAAHFFDTRNKIEPASSVRPVRRRVSRCVSSATSNDGDYDYDYDRRTLLVGLREICESQGGRAFQDCRYDFPTQRDRHMCDLCCCYCGERVCEALKSNEPSGQGTALC